MDKETRRKEEKGRGDGKGRAMAMVAHDWRGSYILRILSEFKAQTDHVRRTDT